MHKQRLVITGKRQEKIFSSAVFPFVRALFENKFQQAPNLINQGGEDPSGGPFTSFQKVINMRLWKTFSADSRWNFNDPTSSIFCQQKSFPQKLKDLPVEEKSMNNLKKMILFVHRPAQDLCRERKIMRTSVRILPAPEGPRGAALLRPSYLVGGAPAWYNLSVNNKFVSGERPCSKNWISYLKNTRSSA